MTWGGVQLDGVVMKNSTISLFTVCERETTGRMAFMLLIEMVYYIVAAGEYF